MKPIRCLDYSPKSIQFCQFIAQSKQLNAEFIQMDLLSSDSHSIQVDLVLDKGTFDAISLNEMNETERNLKFLSKVHSLLTDSGLFLITSKL